MYFISLNIYILLMFMRFHEITCCSCLPTHTQELYCRSQFVIRARVLSNETVTTQTQYGDVNEIMYTVQILEAFRFDGGFDEYSALEIYTAENSGICGVNLETGSEYVLSGNKPNGKHNIRLCELNQKWESLNSCIRDYLINNVYEENCQCQIEYCNEQDMCKPPKSKNSCEVEDRWQEPSPKKTSACQAEQIGNSNNFKCSWSDCPTVIV